MDKKKELHAFFVRVDSLLSALVHRHGTYLEEIGEVKEANELYHMARGYSQESEKWVKT